MYPSKAQYHFFFLTKPFLDGLNVIVWDEWAFIGIHTCSFCVWTLFHMPVIGRDAGITSDFAYPPCDNVFMESAF